MSSKIGAIGLCVALVCGMAMGYMGESDEYGDIDDFTGRCNACIHIIQVVSHQPCDLQ